MVKCLHLTLSSILFGVSTCISSLREHRPNEGKLLDISPDSGSGKFTLLQIGYVEDHFFSAGCMSFFRDNEGHSRTLACLHRSGHGGSAFSFNPRIASLTTRNSHAVGARRGVCVMIRTYGNLTCSVSRRIHSLTHRHIFKRMASVTSDSCRNVIMYRVALMPGLTDHWLLLKRHLLTCFSPQNC